MPQPDDAAVTRVTRAIFVHLYGEKAWTEATFQGERDDCRLLAVQFQEIFRDQWTPFNAAERLADHSCELVFGDLVPGTKVRQIVKDYAESYIEDLSALFGGDGRIRPAFQPAKDVQ